MAKETNTSELILINPKFILFHKRMESHLKRSKDLEINQQIHQGS